MSSMLATRSSWRPSSLSTRLVACLLLYYRPLPGFMTRYGTGNLHTGRFRTLFFFFFSASLLWFTLLDAKPTRCATSAMASVDNDFILYFFFDFSSVLLNLTARIFSLACPSQLFFHTGSGRDQLTCLVLRPEKIISAALLTLCSRY